MVDHDTSKQAEAKVKQVAAAMQHLTSGVDRLEERITKHLTEQLRAVTRPAKEQPEEPVGPAEELAPLAEHIGTQAGRIGSICAYLDNLLDRLEL